MFNITVPACFLLFGIFFAGKSRREDSKGLMSSPCPQGSTRLHKKVKVVVSQGRKEEEESRVRFRGCHVTTEAQQTMMAMKGDFYLFVLVLSCLTLWMETEAQWKRGEEEEREGRAMAVI